MSVQQQAPSASDLFFLFDQENKDGDHSSSAATTTEDIEDESMSSADEEKQRTGNSQKRVSKNDKNRSTPNMAQIDPRLKLNIMPLSQVHRTCPYVLDPSSATTTTSTANKSKNDKKAGHTEKDFYDMTENPHAIPDRHILLLEVVAKQPYVNYDQIGTGQSKRMTTSELTLMYQQHAHQRIPACDAFHDNDVLYQAGKRRLKCGLTVEMPPCKNKSACKGYSYELKKGLPIGHQGYVLMAFMTPSEWQLCNENGRVPSNARECLLCLRYEMTRWIFHLRAHQFNTRVNLNVSFQIFRNKTEGSGAYKLNAVMRPQGKAENRGGEAYFDVFVQNRYSQLFWQYDAEQKLWCINQNAIIADQKAHRPMSTTTESETKSEDAGNIHG